MDIFNIYRVLCNHNLISNNSHAVALSEETISMEAYIKVLRLFLDVRKYTLYLQ